MFRPVGAAEFAPYRRIWLHEDYAVAIARDWNTRESARTGYVTRFVVDAAFITRYPVQRVGNRKHLEYWIPASELTEFNSHIIGPIAVIHEFRAESSHR